MLDETGAEGEPSMESSMPGTAEKPLLLVTLCGGGWHRETVRILESLPPDEYRFAYVYGHQGGVHGAARLTTPCPGPRYPIHYLGPTRKTASRFVANPIRLMISFLEAFRLMRALRPDALLAVGTATAVPLFVAARIYRIPCIFVESLTRVERLSLTGRIIDRLKLASRFYVQWPSLTQRHPSTRFAGAVI